jgi:hypothetical protein
MGRVAWSLMTCHTYVDMIIRLEKVSLLLISCFCCSICGESILDEK